MAVNHLPTVDPEETLLRIDAVAGQGFPVEGDVRQPESVLAMVDEVVRNGGGIDLLVSNAAVNPLVPWDEITVELFDSIQETNLRGTWLVCQSVAKQMIKQGRGGAIVAVSSISAWVGAADQIVYCATKAGVSMLIKALSIVLGPHGIRCNAVLPGAISTPMSSALVDPGSPARAYYLERTPLGRIGEPEDIGDVIAFLLSDDARFMTSAEILVDGGFVINAE